jgi:hypothetical protein
LALHSESLTKTAPMTKTVGTRQSPTWGLLSQRVDPSAKEPRKRSDMVREVRCFSEEVTVELSTGQRSGQGPENILTLG